MLTSKAREYREILAMIQELEEEAEALKAAMIAEMEVQEVDTLQADIFTIRYTKYQSSRVDTTALKKELPDVAARYTKTTETRRFQVA
jgi:predicted phage-related endonuclease